MRVAQLNSIFVSLVAQHMYCVMRGLGYKGTEVVSILLGPIPGKPQSPLASKSIVRSNRSINK